MQHTIYYLGSQRLRTLAEEAVALLGGRLRPFGEFPGGEGSLVLYGLDRPLPQGLCLPGNLLLLQGEEASPLVLGARLHNSLMGIETGGYQKTFPLYLPVLPPRKSLFLRKHCREKGPWHRGEALLLFPGLPSLLWLHRHRRELPGARIFCLFFRAREKKELQGQYPEVPLRFLTVRELKRLLKKPSFSQGSDIFSCDPDLCQEQGQDQIQD